MKDFTLHPEALELKQLGFDEPCFGYYVDGELRGVDLGMEELGGVKPYYQRFGFHVLSNHDIDNSNKVVVTAPTYSQAFRWFREKGYIMNIVCDAENVNHRYFFDIFYNIQFMFESGYEFETYEEAELACLKKLIEISKNK